jgi:serine/threonine protein kinase
LKKIKHIYKVEIMAKTAVRRRSRFQRQSRKYNKKSKQWKRSKRRTGGGLVGQGTFGCAYSPSITCRSPAQASQPNKISKLVTDDDLQNTVLTSGMFTDIDPEQSYFLSKFETCKWKDISVIERAGLTSCGAKRVKRAVSDLLHSTLHVMTMEHGGDSFEIFWQRVRKTPQTINFEEFVGAFMHLAAGLELAHSRDVYHFDITPKNIVFHSEISPMRPRFIDFDHTKSTSQIYTDKNLKFLNTYLYWPPHALLLIALGNGTGGEAIQWVEPVSQTMNPKVYDWAQDIQTLPEQLRELVGFPLPVDSDYMKNVFLLCVQIEQQKQTMTKDNRYNFIRKYAAWVDIYALLITMAVTMKKLSKNITLQDEAQKSMFSRILEACTNVDKYSDTKALRPFLESLLVHTSTPPVPSAPLRADAALMPSMYVTSL